MNDTQEKLHQEMLSAITEDDADRILDILRRGYQVPHDLDVKRWHLISPIDYTIAYQIFNNMHRGSCEDIGEELCGYDLDVWQRPDAHGNKDTLSAYGRYPLEHVLDNPKAIEYLRGLYAGGADIVTPYINLLRWAAHHTEFVKPSDMKMLVMAGYSPDDASRREFDHLEITTWDVLESDLRDGNGKANELLYALGRPIRVRLLNRMWTIRQSDN